VKTVTVNNKRYVAGGTSSFAKEEESFFVSPYYQSSYIFPYNPDSLCQLNNYDTYDEMRFDDQVKAVMALKKSIVVGSGWNIVSENEEISEYITDNLENLNNEALEETFEEILFDILSAYDYGFSLSECIYELNEQGLYQVKTIKVRPPHSFRFEIDDKGNVVKIIQSTNTGDVEFEPNKFMHLAYQMEFGNPYGTSDLKSAYLPWKIKKFFIKMFAKYGERFGTPTIHGKYEDSANKEDIDKFFEILKSIQNNTVLATPKSADVEFIFAGKEASDLYDTAIDKFNLWIARAILVPDLLGLSGSKTQGGSYSLGEQHFKLFLSMIKKDRQLFERKITQRVIRPLVEANWGKGIDVKFEFLPYSEADELELSKLWLEAVKAKAFKPNPDEVNNFRRIVNYPEGEVETPAPAPTPFDKEDENVEVTGYAARELTVYEKKMNFSEIEKTLNLAEDNIETVITNIAKKINIGLIQEIENKKILEKWKPEKINDLKLKYLKELNFAFRSNFKSLFTDSLNEAKQELFPQGDKKYTDAEILPDEFLRIVEAESFKLVGDYETSLLKNTRNILMEGIKRGTAINKILGEVKQSNEKTSAKWIEAVIRTKTTEIYNSARKIYWETDKLASQLVEAYQFSAILDERTSEICRRLDKKIFKKGEYIDQVTPPLHINCRSLLTPITKFESYRVDREISIENLKKLGGHLL